MSYQLYVGNYPSKLSREDVADIFQDFPGVKVQKFFKKEKKSYSFLTCNDINQVVSVIQQKNNITIYGRKLIVRATDAGLQEYVELILQEKNNNPEFVMENEPNEVTDELSCDSSVNIPPLVTLRDEIGAVQKCEAVDQRRVITQRSRSQSSQSSFGECNYVDKSCSSDSEAASFRRYPKDSFLEEKGKFSECVWLSVTNFPIGTRVRSLLELFEDYEPIYVQMICNVARRDKNLTEAHVCFLNREIADDVILTFDNTMFHGRLLLVNDIEDLKLMNELLSVSNACNTENSLGKQY